MELNIGDYVRTDTGIIEKIEGIHKQNKTNNTIIKLNKMGGGKYAHIVDINSDFEKEFDKDFSRGNIIKSSPNIIDLIEVGDYVNGHRVIDFMLENGKRKGIIVDAGIWGFDIDEIKTIVTREMFESMEYKIGDKENE